MIKALRNGNDEQALSFVQQAGFNPNEVDERSGDSILHLVIKMGLVDVLRALLARFANAEENRLNIEVKNSEGKVGSANCRLHLWWPCSWATRTCL